MVRLITDFEVTSPIQNIGLVWPFPSGTGIANLHYPTLRVGISTSIKKYFIHVKVYSIAITFKRFVKPFLL
jgi:hypothetical protein